MVKPILFNTEMVRAILEGRKSCTRRIAKFLPGKNPNWTGYIKDGNMLYNGTNEPCIRQAPYKTGDILYVRETFIQAAAHTFWYRADDNSFWYKADDNSWMPKGLHWKPSIHMPKEAARIWLRVTNVKMERLQEITEDQTEEEGFLFTPPCLHMTGENYCDIDEPCTSEIKYCDMGAGELFGKVLWNSTIKKSDLDRYGWDANPWVWIIEFERCEKPKE